MKRSKLILKILLALGAFNVLLAMIMFPVNENLGVLFCLNAALFGVSAIVRAEEP